MAAYLAMTAGKSVYGPFPRLISPVPLHEQFASREGGRGHRELTSYASAPVARAVQQAVSPSAEGSFLPVPRRICLTLPV